MTDSGSQPPKQASRRRPTAPPSFGRPLIATGGPDPATPPDQVRLTVGSVMGAHGTDGEMKVRLVTDDPEHFVELRQFYLGDETAPRKVRSIRFHNGVGLVRLAGIDSPEQATTFRGLPLRISGRDARPLAPGQFFLYQLIGLEAVTEDGTSLGRVADLIETGARDVFVVRPTEPGPDLLFPDIPECVLEIDPAAGRMVIRPLVYAD